MKRFFKILLVLFMFVTTPVFALSDDLFRSDDRVSVSDDLNGSSFVAGNDVQVDSKVNGMLFSAGNSVNQSGESDYLFTAGNIVKVNSQKTKDAYIAGNDVSVKESDFERDVYVAGNIVTFESNAGRNVYIGGSKVTISGTINGNLNIYSDNITIEDNTKVKGMLKYPEKAKIVISKNASINSKSIMKDSNGTVSINTEPSFSSRIMSNLFSIVNLFVLGLFLMLLFPKLFEKIEKMDKNTILSNLGFGVLSLFILPIAALIIMLTMVGLSTGFILLDFYIVCVYLSSLLCTYYLANILLNKNIKNKYLVLLIGLLGLFVLKLIPFISILTEIFVLCIGLGIVVNLIFSRK